MARAPATTPRRRADGAPAVELTLLSRVAYRGQEITGPRLRGLLALLAGDLRTGCSTARLVEGLWPDELPEHPAKALQIIVSRARAQLGADVIASTPTGYRLALTEDQVDTSAVLRSASASAARARAGDHAAALAHAEAGLALWEGADGRRHRPGRPGGRAARGAGVDLPVAGAGPGAGAVTAGPPRRGGRAARRAGPRASAGRGGAGRAAARRGGDGGPVGGAGPLRGLPPLAARRARHRPRPRPPGRAPAAAAGHGAGRSATGCRTSPTRCSAATTTSPRWRTCCARPGSPRSSGPAGSARPGSRRR